MLKRRRQWIVHYTPVSQVDADFIEAGNEAYARFVHRDPWFGDLTCTVAVRNLVRYLHSGKGFTAFTASGTKPLPPV